MSLSFDYWAPAPNRHTEPFLDAALDLGALRRIVYGRDRLEQRLQLGTPPIARDGGVQVTLGPGSSRRRRIVERILGSQVDFHLMYCFGDPLCRDAMRACARLGKPYFVFAESLKPRSPWHPRAIARKLLYGRLAQRAAGIYSIGRKAAADYERLGAERARIMPAIYFGPQRRRPPIAASRRGIVYCGRLLDLKGLDVLAGALRVLAARNGQASLDVVGDGPARSRLAGVTNDAIHVTFHGAVSSDRIPALLGNAAVLVLPTRHREGYGYVVNEALAAGTPVVVSDVVGAREIVVSGRTGVVFRTGDHEALADAIELAQKLHDDPARLAGDMEITERGFDAAEGAKYLLASADERLRGSGVCFEPPWHRAVNALGGNDEARWWAGFRGCTEAAEEKYPVSREHDAHEDGPTR